MGLNILLVDDHKIMTEGLRALIEKQPGMEVVADAENGRVALQMTRKFNPHVVVMDINMPDMNGIDAARQIITEFPKTKVIAFSMYADRQFVVGMLKAGVSAYLLKDSAFEELIQAIRTVVAGETYLSSKITGTVVKEYVEKLLLEDASTAAALTPREREVVQLIAEGHTTRQIADRLNVSVKTVESHRRTTMEKLGVSSIAELTKFAIREGLTSLNI